jgi:pimeloyl-ACP methyl ester carboxylesterase
MPVNELGDQDYVLKRISRSRFTLAREVRYHIREWGPVSAPLLILLHGARDGSSSFQFVIDSFEREWRVIAPDWRGHGQSGWVRGGYWISDFLCDLDALLAEIASHEPVVLIGHSMGGHVASLYAGIKPHRVKRLIILDALGNPLDRSPVRIVEMLSELVQEEATVAMPRVFTSIQDMAQQLLRVNSRLDMARAITLAAGISRPLSGGGFAWAWDPTFRRYWSTLHSDEEWADCWQKIDAPVLGLLASDGHPNSPTRDPEIVKRRTQAFRNLTLQVVPDAGHNVHVDAPEFVARAIEAFIP